jgi:hypothetical protein
MKAWTKEREKKEVYSIKERRERRKDQKNK